MNKQIKERPILFSGEMVRAILEGRKTQTRRAIKPQPVFYPESASLPDMWAWGKETALEFLLIEWMPSEYPSDIIQACPYGKPGDRLYVRETFYAYGRWETRFSAKKGRDEWHFVDMTTERGLQYKYSDSPPELINKKKDAQIVRWWKRPSLFMPRAASRILLEITDVRVERLHDISEADAIVEGVEFKRVGITQAATGWKHYKSGFYNAPSARESFFTLWESINGPESLESNPWVWVVLFKQVEK